MKARHIVIVIALAALPCLQAFAGKELAATTDHASVRRDEPQVQWVGPDGEPLPFRTDGEVLEFLRTARIVSAKDIDKGINKTRKVLLEEGGVRAHAAFRTVRKRLSHEDHWERKLRSTFRDSFAFECAAYELSRLLGIDRVPPVVERTYKGARGSLQIWVEGALDEETRREENRLPPPSAEAGWDRQKVVRHVFDMLIYNQDRNLGNMLIDPRWNVWLIDHTRTFSPYVDLPNRDKIRRCERELWNRLRTVDRELVRERLDPYLQGIELKTLFVRWDKLVAHFQGLIDERGEGPVLEPL